MDLILLSHQFDTSVDFSEVTLDLHQCEVRIRAYLSVEPITIESKSSLFPLLHRLLLSKSLPE